MDRDTLELTRARRYLEVRRGELLGDVEAGQRTDLEPSLASEGSDLDKDMRYRLRKLADAKDRAERGLGQIDAEQNPHGVNDRWKKGSSPGEDPFERRSWKPCGGDRKSDQDAPGASWSKGTWTPDVSSHTRAGWRKQSRRAGRPGHGPARDGGVVLSPAHKITGPDASGAETAHHLNSQRQAPGTRLPGRGHHHALARVLAAQLH